MKTVYQIWCHIREVKYTEFDGEIITDNEEFCPVEFDLLAEAETYCDDLMVE